MIREHH